MSQIRIERLRGFYGMFRGLEIIVDGVSIGKIRQGQTLLLDAPEKSQFIWGKMDWGETTRLGVANYKLNEKVVFRGRFTLNIFKSLGIAKLPFDVYLLDDA